jgi:hypothetical protein
MPVCRSFESHLNIAPAGQRSCNGARSVTLWFGKWVTSDTCIPRICLLDSVVSWTRVVGRISECRGFGVMEYAMSYVLLWAHPARFAEMTSCVYKRHRMRYCSVVQNVVICKPQQ